MNYLCLVVVLMLSLGACVQRPTVRYYNASAWAPYDRGNLLENSSFEQIDANTLHSWSAECRSSSQKAHTGERSLLLSASAGQTVVCTSAPFSVQPGHHEISLWVAGDRLGGSAVSIRLKIFDRHGRELPFTGHYLDQVVDISELNSSLRAMQEFSVESFQQIQLVPGDYPLDSGWFPKHAHHARLEFQLRAQAQPLRLWIDDVSVRYSKWNFTLRQRVARAVEKFSPDDPVRFFPQPQAVFFWGAPLMLVSPADVQVHWQRNPKLPGEAYRIRPSVDAEGRVQVTIDAGSARAEFYAAQTLERLFAKDAEGKLVFHPARIDDFPSWPRRSALLPEKPEDDFATPAFQSQWLAWSRFNLLFWRFDRQLPGAPLLAASERGLVDWGILANPYEIPEGKSPVLYSDARFWKNFWDDCERYIDAGAKVFMFATDDHVPHEKDKRFAYLLDQPADQKRFGTLARAQADRLKEIHARLKRRGGQSTDLWFVSPWYNQYFVDRSDGRGQAYLNEIGKIAPKLTRFVWTGSTVRSLTIDNLQVSRYRAALGRHDLVLWDNTLYARRLRDFWGRFPERQKLCSYFEPYETKPPQSAGLGVHLNSRSMEITRIQLATAGAYLWNARDYDPESALWTYLVARFGADTADLLLRYDEALWQKRRWMQRRLLRKLSKQLAGREEALLRELRGLNF